MLYYILYIVLYSCSKVPSFDSVFDEETFYIFFFLLVIFSIVGALIASRYITLDDPSIPDLKKE